MRALARPYRREAVETIVELMRDAAAPHAVRLAAARELLDRDVGRPQQMIDATVTHRSYAALVIASADPAVTPTPVVAQRVDVVLPSAGGESPGRSEADCDLAG